MGQIRTDSSEYHKCRASQRLLPASLSHFISFLAKRSLVRSTELTCNLSLIARRSRDKERDIIRESRNESHAKVECKFILFSLLSGSANVV